MIEQSSIPRILLTIGEPAGIGPELIIKLAQNDFTAQLIVIGDGEHLQKLSKHLNFPLELIPIDWNKPSVKHQVGRLYLEHLPFQETVTLGKLSKTNAVTVLDSLHKASELALQKKVQALVTAPIHKANINQIEASFLGHTEYFASKAKVEKVVMMLATRKLRMALATTHVPLNEVSHSITQEMLKEVLLVIEHSFRIYGLKQPKIAVCGLNPHAGESGLLGHEEEEVIEPVIRALKILGLNVEGPFPADSLFTPQKREVFDVFLAMFHDQGLPVVKAIGFGKTANITLGLPYIRTSVDHGTALDIADQNCASPSSFIYAINYAIEMSQGKLPQ